MVLVVCIIALVSNRTVLDKRETILVSKMTFSSEVNSLATVFHQVLKSSVEEMTLPELSIQLVSAPRRALVRGNSLSSIVMGVKDRVSTAVSDELDRL